MISAKVILDSLNPFTKKRLITFELHYPRFIHAELMTHRVFSRNSASSRAIPISKVIEKVKNDPAMPVFWGAAQKGMVADNQIENIEAAKEIWLEARDAAIKFVEKLNQLGLHKQIPNRILETWFNITVILTATEFDNFYTLRRHRDAQPEIKTLADCMYDSAKQSVSVERLLHTPYIQPDEESLDFDTKCRVSSARCARVSYLTHDGKRSIDKDLELFLHLTTGSGFGHWSPMEHVATALQENIQCGNFIGWKQFRKTFENESGVIDLHNKH